MNQKQRRAQARKEAKQKKIIIITVCTLIILALVGFFLVDAFERGEERVFVNGRDSITLYEDGTFTASLPHGMNLSGTFTETTTDGLTAIAFTYDGRTEVGNIIDGEDLTIPHAWEVTCGHGHGSLFRLR